MAVGAHGTGPGLPEFFALTNILIVVAIVYVAGRKAIKKALQERRDSIYRQLIEAQKQLENTRALLERSKAEMAQLSDLQKRLVEDARVQGEQIRQQMIEDANKTAKRFLDDAKLLADSEFGSASLSLRESLISAAVDEVLRLAGESGSSKRLHDELINRFIAEEIKQ